MKKLKKPARMIEYGFYVNPIGIPNDSAYEAVIPAFNNAIVFGDTIKELEAGIRFMIETEIADLKKAKKSIPEPDYKISHSGKLMLRMNPALHAKLAREAVAHHTSLNKYIAEKLNNGNS